jgi:hypothetical protein
MITSDSIWDGFETIEVLVLWEISLLFEVLPKKTSRVIWRAPIFVDHPPSTSRSWIYRIKLSARLKMAALRLD